MSAAVLPFAPTPAEAATARAARRRLAALRVAAVGRLFVRVYWWAESGALLAVAVALSAFPAAFDDWDTEG